MARSKIIILNGPPGSGKDTVGEILRRRTNAYMMEFKASIFPVVFAITGINRNEWFERYHDRKLKDKPWAALNGKTCREMMIFVSEEVCKKLYGKEYYGIHAVTEIMMERRNNIIFTDGGFKEEVQYVIDKLHGLYDVFIVNLYRNGCDFRNDSRDYLTHKDLHWCYFHPIDNVNGKPEVAAMQIFSEIHQGHGAINIIRREKHGKHCVGLSWN